MKDRSATSTARSLPSKVAIWQFPMLLVGGAVLVPAFSNALRSESVAVGLAGRPAVVSIAVALLDLAIGLSAARLVVTRRAPGRWVWMFAGGKRLDRVATR